MGKTKVVEYRGKGFYITNTCDNFKCPNCGTELVLDEQNDHGYTMGDEVDQICLGCNQKIRVSFGSWHLLEIMVENLNKAYKVSRDLDRHTTRIR